MSNLISFSVWGNDSKYLKGCIENIYLAKEIYPGWITRFYCDSKVESSFISKIESLGAEIVVMKTLRNNWEGLFWRFFPIAEPDVEIFISRDIDSRLNEREKAAVDEWLQSDKPLHCMRDHIEHNVPILGGMWGCRLGILRDIKILIDDWGKYDYKGSDQDFLRLKVWENYKNLAIVHDKFCNGFVIDQIVHNVEEYHKQRAEMDDYRTKTLIAKEKYIKESVYNGLPIPSAQELAAIFTEVPELSPIRYNDKNQIVTDYVYDPIKFFGQHDIRPFPPHKEMKNGSHVGEIIE